eukprot:TRINITY_DN10593_c0_g1_i2.p1 TRINITY_DN10593_c0_g1~~TRINITY_DN10593_c0_g1_i2.p1  ORF type:complete len:218 (-),score=60.34 TRINITY_DN10593_c0_g1_i2:25-678(-)
MNDQSGCLMRLMKYPPVEDIYSLMEKASLIEQKLDSGAVYERTPSPVKPATPPAAVRVVERQQVTHPQTPTTNSNVSSILQGAPKLVNDVMETFAKINPFGALASEEKFPTQPIPKTTISRSTSAAQDVNKVDSAALNRSQEISQGVGIRIGELTQELRQIVKNSVVEEESQKAELIIAELDALAGVLGGLIDPDVSNMWVIVDPLTGQRKIQANHE